MLEGAPNFRDLGGMAGQGGRIVRPGQLLRSNQLTDLSAADVARLDTYRVRVVCDLRTPHERALAPDRWPAMPHDAPAPALQRVEAAEHRSSAAAQPGAWLRRLRDPAFDADAARAYMLTGYRSMPAHFAGLLRELFALLDAPQHAGPAGAGPVLVHCVAGKDRTGFVVALLLHALGATPQAIFADYLASPPHVAPARLRHAEEVPPDPHDAQRMTAARSVMAGVDRIFLEAAWAEIERKHGSLDRYLAAVGLDDERRARLCDRFLCPPHLP